MSANVALPTLRKDFVIHSAMLAEANSKRRKLLQRNNLDGTLADIKKLLDEAVLAEIAGMVERDLDAE